MLALPMPVVAQGIIIPEPAPLPEPVAIVPVVVELHSAEAVVDGPVATVHLTQVFRNQSQQQMEGTYLFPMPEEAAISDFQMTVDGKVLEGELLKAEDARRVYEEIVRRQLDPALLEYVGRDLFQARIFPIPAGASRTVELTYRQVLARQNDLFRFTYPLGVQRNGGMPAQAVAVTVELRNQPSLRTIYSPSHDVTIQRLGNEGALVGFEARDVRLEQDFVLFFGTDDSAIGLNLLSYKPAGEDGFFLLLAAPGVETPVDSVVRRDLVLVLDVSGSMEGEKLEQAKAAAHYVVEHLNAGDRFNLIAFSTGVKLWQAELQPAEADNRHRALVWIDSLQAGGSTDINRSLLEALAQLQPAAGGDGDRPGTVLYLTDGLPTQGIKDPDRIITNALDNAPDERTLRLFTFGVGYDVNTDLLDTVSRELGGRSSYVSPGERIDEAVSHFYAGISTPVLAQVEVELGGQIIDEVYPYPLSDLFAGDQLVLVGRYRDGGSTDVRLQGRVNGERHVFSYPEQELATAGGEDFVARLWAMRKIGALLREVRRGGASQELVDAIVELSLAYGIVTPYTSYLVEEPDQAVAAPAAADGEPAPMPRGARAAAEAEAPAALEAYAAAPASGEGAVAASKARQELEDAATVDEAKGVRYVAGKTFTQEGNVDVGGRLLPLWVDTLYDADLPAKTVGFGSTDYFELAQDRRVAQWLSVASEMVLVLDGVAYRITAGHEVRPEGGTPEPLQAPVPNVTEEESSGLWDSLLDMLRRLAGQ